MVLSRSTAHKLTRPRPSSEQQQPKKFPKLDPQTMYLYVYVFTIIIVIVVVAIINLISDAIIIAIPI